jgi:hypothetical protein
VHGAQNLRQRFRVELGRSTRAGGKTRQSNLLAAGLFLVHLLLHGSGKELGHIICSRTRRPRIHAHVRGAKYSVIDDGQFKTL